MRICLQCAGPRCHHVLRTVPPSQSARYAAGHDEGMFQTMTAWLGALPGSQEQIATARYITTLPMRLGGLGLRSAARTGPGASWADALPMLHDRLRTATEEMLAQLRGEPEGCLRELQVASMLLEREGFVSKPSWEELKARARPPPPLTPWGMATWLAVLRVFRFRTPLSGDRSARQIMRRRPGSFAVPFRPRGRSPTGPEFQVQPMHFRTLVLERLRLPLLLTEARCECGGQNDIFGRHRAACPHSGRLKRRRGDVGPSVPRGWRDSHPQH